MTVALASNVTVYVPAVVMFAVSAAPGTAWGDQLAATLQLPPSVLVQVSVAAERRGP